MCLPHEGGFGAWPSRLTPPTLGSPLWLLSPLISVQQNLMAGLALGPASTGLSPGVGGIVFPAVTAEEEPSVSQTVKLLFLWLVPSSLLCSQIIFPRKFLDRLAIFTEVSFPRGTLLPHER